MILHDVTLAYTPTWAIPRCTAIDHLAKVAYNVVFCNVNSEIPPKIAVYIP